MPESVAVLLTISGRLIPPLPSSIPNSDASCLKLLLENLGESDSKISLTSNQI